MFAKSAPARISPSTRPARARLRDLLGGGAVGDRDQDVRDPVPVPVRIRSPARHRRQMVVDVALGDVDLVLDLALAYLRDHDLFPDLLAKLRELVAVAFEGVPELAQGELVLLRDPQQRPVEPVVVDAYAGIARELELEPGEDQPFEHLPAQCMGRWRSGAGAAKLLAYPLQPYVQLAPCDDVVIDDGDDAVESGAGRGLGRCARCAGPTDRARDQACPPSSPERREERHQNSFPYPGMLRVSNASVPVPAPVRPLSTSWR